MMSNLRPGGFRLTDRAMRYWNLPKKSIVLDIGCGRGETVEYLEKEYGFKVKGIDLSDDLVKEGLARNPDLDIKKGDGEFLEDYPSHSFNGALMECVLSVTDKPDEVLHEVYCVLKKGGKLFISDLYIKDPEPDLYEYANKKVKEMAEKPHDHDECGISCAVDHQKRAVNFRVKGRFLMEPLLNQLNEIGYNNILFEDCSLELDNYAAEKVLKDGTLEGCFCKEALIPVNGKTSYFILTAEKPL